MRPDEYRRLVAQIEAALPPQHPGQPRRSYESYEVGARHYDARGRYTATNTCNQWVGDVLAEAGVKIGYWTPHVRRRHEMVSASGKLTARPS